jgi:hypothetical protein
MGSFLSFNANFLSWNGLVSHSSKALAGWGWLDIFLCRLIILSCHQSILQKIINFKDASPTTGCSGESISGQAVVVDFSIEKSAKLLSGEDHCYEETNV